MNLIMIGNENEVVTLPTWERVYFGNVCYAKGTQELD
jgi:hypothetical protein